MVFLLILLIIFLIIITIRIKFEFINLRFISLEKDHLNKDYQINVIIYIFQKIPILKTKITNKKLENVIKNEKIRETIKEQKTKIFENKRDIDKQIIKGIKSIKIDIKEMNLLIQLGTEDAAITAFIIPLISTIIAMFLSQKVKKYNDKQNFLIQPVYINQNLINIEFSGIFQIKMIHIINTICILNKKKKGDKYERTSNRRSYDYGYEQH